MKLQETKQFLDFMLANGFNPENYNEILELMQSVPESLSQYLKNYKQFLLSHKVNYHELLNYEIKGAKGYLNGLNEFFIPSTVEANEYFYSQYRKKAPNKRHGYSYPNIADIDVIIGYHNFDAESLTQLKFLLAYPRTCDYYIGCRINKNDLQKAKKINMYEKLLKTINYNNVKQHEIVHDLVSSDNEEYYMIKTKTR